MLAAMSELAGAGPAAASEAAAAELATDLAESLSLDLRKQVRRVSHMPTGDIQKCPVAMLEGCTYLQTQAGGTAAHTSRSVHSAKA